MKKIICFILAGILTLTNVYAAENSFSYDENTYTVSLSGNSAKAFSVTVKEGEEPVSQTNKLVYTRAFEAVGDYKIFVPMVRDSAEMDGKTYTVLVNGVVAGTFTYIDVSGRSAYVSNISAATSSELYNELINNSALLGLEQGAVTQQITDILFTRLPFSDASDFSNKLKYATVLNTLNANGTGVGKEFLCKNDNLFAADLTSDFAALSQTGADKLISLLAGLDYTEKTFDEQYNDKKVAAICYDVQHWTELAEILSSGIVTGIDPYSSIINKASEELMKRREEFTSIAEIVRCFNEVKAANGNPPVNPAPGIIVPGVGNVGGNSGGGGGGGGGFSVAPPVSEPNNEVFELFKFEDLNHYLWAEDAIYALKEKGIISGISEKLYAPEKNITRAELSKLICQVFNLKEGSQSFADVSEGSWYKPYVAACAAAGIILGDGANFYPENNVTRQDAAVMIFRALKQSGIEIDGTYYFKDTEEISDYAGEAVSALASNKIIKGVGDDNFAPHNNIDRASAAVLLYNTMNEFVK